MLLTLVKRRYLVYTLYSHFLFLFYNDENPGKIFLLLFFFFFNFFLLYFFLHAGAFYGCAYTHSVDRSIHTIYTFLSISITPFYILHNRPASQIALLPVPSFFFFSSRQLQLHWNFLRIRIRIYLLR